MKTYVSYPILVCALLITAMSNAQIRISGGIDVAINIPIPEVVIVKKERPPTKVNRHIPVKNSPSLGTILNQNGPFEGRLDYAVVDAELIGLGNHAEELQLFLHTGETLTMVLQTTYPQDYNYHYSCSTYQSAHNQILGVFLNNQELALRHGNVSLQPFGDGGFHAILNLHSQYEGDFNGTVNF